MGYRFVGVINDAKSAQGGSTYDELTDSGPLSYPVPSTFFPVVSGAVDPGFEDKARDDEVRGIRGSMAPYPFRGAPTATFRARLYPGIAKWVLPRVLGKTGTPDGAPPAAVESLFSPVGHGGRLPAINLVMAREDQLDYLWGCWVESAEIEVTSDGDVFVTTNLRALYHETKPLGVTTFTPNTSTYLDPYAGVTLSAKTGPTGTLTAIDCIGSLTFTFNNTLSDDDDVRFCKGINVVKELVDGSYRYRHYPTRHKIGRQEITGSVGFGEVQPSLEERRLITTADVLQAELAGNPAGTTPEADELLRFTFHAHVLTGGGADELAEEGEIKSSYEFSAHLDPATSKDFEAVFVEAAAVTLPS